MPIQYIDKNKPFNTKQKIWSLLSHCNYKKIIIDSDSMKIIFSTVPEELRSFAKSRIDSYNRWQKTRQRVRMQKTTNRRRSEDKYSSLILNNKGKKIEAPFICCNCKRKQISGYLFVDSQGNEYIICKYCCNKGNDYAKILYTPMGNKR